MEISSSAVESRDLAVRFGTWLADALNHAFGNPREEALHQPPLVGIQPYSDRPLRRGSR
jgi:hypothetical protein